MPQNEEILTEAEGRAVLKQIFREFNVGIEEALQEGLRAPCGDMYKLGSLVVEERIPELERE